MKHLFLIHSPITFLVAASVIKKLEIANTDAIIVFQEFEKIQSENDFQGVSINEFFQKKSFVNKLTNFIKHFNIPARIDYFINEITGGEKFIVYLPVLTQIGKSFVTNSHCTGFHFIEEGLLNYYKEETLSGITVINSRDSWRRKGFKKFLNEAYILMRGYNFKLQALPFTYSCYGSVKSIHYFGFTEDAFPLVLNNKTVVPFNKNAFSNIRQSSAIDLNNQFIWIGDPGVVQHGFDENIYLDGIEEGCIKFLKKNNVTHALLKFHRDEQAYLRQKVTSIFAKNNITTSLISDGTVMELLLLNAHNVSLIGIYSSLLYYAAVMGHAAYSIYDFVKAEYARVLQGRDMQFYWQQVRLISETTTLV